MSLIAEQGDNIPLARGSGAAELKIDALPGRVLRWLIAIYGFLLVAHALGLLMAYGFGYSYVFGLVPLFNIGLEGNIPTFYSSLLFLTNALLLGVISRLGIWERRQRYVWVLLALVFCFLAVDESAVIHEKLIEPVRQLLGTEGFLYFAWVIPYLILSVILGILIFPVIWSLGYKFRFLFGLSATAYLGGAVGVEMLGGAYYEAIDETVDLNYRLFQTVEETLEFCGLTILVYTLLELLRSKAKNLNIRVAFETPH